MEASHTVEGIMRYSFVLAPLSQNLHRGILEVDNQTIANHANVDAGVRISIRFFLERQILWE